MYSAIEDVVPHVSGYGRWPTAMEPIPQITIRGVLRNVKDHKSECTTTSIIRYIPLLAYSIDGKIICNHSIKSASQQ